MDLLKTPSIQSLLDSDLESVESLQCLDIEVEELDEIEYALPASEAPTLAEVLCSEDDGEIQITKSAPEPTVCSALQVDFLQAVSQQLSNAQDRSSAGAATAMSVSGANRLTVGTAHGHLLSFQDQVLRWVCDSNSDRGAVSCLAYNDDGSRILVGFGRGMICQYESSRGVILRRVTLGGELWGILRVTWAGTTGLALDTGGSVWLIKFSRPLGVRSSKTSCLFSGARGEVVTMAARDSRILALATLSRVILVAGGRAAGVRLEGPPDTLPVLCWCETDDRLLLCARASTLQWLSYEISGSTITLRPVRKIELKSSPLWMGWVGGSIAIFDANENLRLLGEEYDKPLDLSHIEPVYASAFFKGVWTDGRVSRALQAAGGSALGGACGSAGALSVLGRRGVLRVRARDPRSRARALFAAGHHAHALRLVAAAPAPQADHLAAEFINEVADKPHILSDKTIAKETVKLCLKFQLYSDLWGVVWERGNSESQFVEALGEAVARGELEDAPTPDCTQALLERLAECDPGLLERVVTALPLTSLDPHRATIFTQERGLWRAYAAVANAIGGCVGAMRALVPHVSASCAAGRGARGCGGACGCAGDALLLLAADGLAGRAAAGRPLPAHARPAARHDALRALLSPDGEAAVSGVCPLAALVRHEARAAVRLLEQGWRDPPFAGPLGKQNRLRAARALLQHAETLDEEGMLDVVEFIGNCVEGGTLPAQGEVRAAAAALAARGGGERADRCLARLPPAAAAAAARPRLAWRLAADASDHAQAVTQFFRIADLSNVDMDEFFDYLRTRIKDEDAIKVKLKEHLARLAELRPQQTAAVLEEHFPDEITRILREVSEDAAAEVAQTLLDSGALKGDAAAVYLRILCNRSPDRVPAYLNAGVVRPEDALATVREYGPRQAVPQCLEATGDLSAALDEILHQVVDCKGEKRTRLETDAAELCVRASSSLPHEVASAMWSKLLPIAETLPAGALLAALRHVPAEALVRQACRSRSTAASVVRRCAEEAAAWRAAAGVVRRELHARGRLARRAAARGCGAWSARCEWCGGALAGHAVRLLSCAHGSRAAHRACPSTPCERCPRHSPPALSLPARAPAAPPALPPLDADTATATARLQILAPPRPDLEGIV